MLQKQNIPIIFGRGLDTKTNEQVVQADRMLELENAVFTKKMSFSTRFGSRSLSRKILGQSTEIENPRALFTFQDELLLSADNNLYSYLPSTDEWANRGSLSSVSVESKSIQRNTKSQSIPDMNTLKGISVYAWEEGSEVYATVIDEASGLPIVAATAMSSGGGRKPKVFASSSHLLVYYINGSNWYVRTLNPLSPLVFSSAAVVASDIEDNFDLCEFSQQLVFIYNTTGGNCKIGYITPEGLIGTALEGYPSVVTTTTPGDEAVTITAKLDNDLNDRIIAFIADNNASNKLTAVIYGLNLFSGSGLEVTNIYINYSGYYIRNLTALYLPDKQSVRVYVEHDQGDVNLSQLHSVTIDLSGNILAQVLGAVGLGLTTKAFYGSDGSIYFGVAFESTYQSTYFILRDTESTELFQVAGVVAKYEGDGFTNRNSSLTNVVDYQFPNLIKTLLQTESGGLYSLVGVQSTKIEFSTPQLFKELGKNTHIAGGMLYDYDGVSAFEHNFHLFPEVTLNSVANTGGSLSNGTYQIVYCYEWTDNQGQVHRSAPSIPLVVTLSGGTNTQKINLNVINLNLTKKTAKCGRSEVMLVGYRTIANGTVFYRFSSQIAPLYNNPLGTTKRAPDITAADATITSNDVLYTTGGVLENFSPGSAGLVEEYRNRLFVAGLEDTTLIRYTQERVLNEDMNFAEELSFRADTGKGGIKALAKLDEKLLIFKPNDIYYQIGLGPTSTGGQDDYQPPIFITTDVGTIDPQSVVSMPLGVMFKTAKGYYLLSRALEPIYIGQEVEKYNGLKVTSAILCDDFNEVRFSHSDGVSLVYNYNQGQWSVFTNKDAISGVLWQNKWALLKANGVVSVETKDSFKDDQRPVTKKITTAWFQGAALQGAQRIYRVMFIGKLKSAHRLKIEVAYDFDSNVQESFFYDTDEILGSSYYGEGYYGEAEFYGGSDPVYQVEIRPSRQKCQAIRFTLSDLNDDNIDGAGFELTGMTIQAGMKQGLFRTNIDKRVGPS